MMFTIVRIFFVIFVFTVSTTAEIGNTDNKSLNCSRYNIPNLLSQKDLDPLTRNRKIWLRILKDTHGLEKYKIFPATKEEEICIKNYILNNSFDINAFSRELSNGGTNAKN